DVDRKSWDVSWSSKKKAFCCATQQLACGQFDCRLQRGWETDWTPAKKAFCCPHGCSDAGCDRLCQLQGSTSTCRERIQRTFAQVGSCAAAHKEVLDQCAECSQCPAAGGLCYQVKEEAEKSDEQEAEAKHEAKLKAQEEAAEAKRMAEEAKRKENAKRRAEEAAEAKRKAEEAEAKRKAEEAEAKRKAEAEAERKAEAAKKTERKEFEAWTHNRDQLPCDKGKDGFMWSFEPANGGPLWRQHPISDPLHTAAGRGFMWQKEGNIWKQVCINVDSAEAPQEPPGAGFMWRHREDDLGAIWEQVPVKLRSAGGRDIPMVSAGEGFMWQSSGAGWEQVPLSPELRQKTRPCNPPGLGMRWTWGKDAWRQEPVPNWQPNALNPSPSVPAGRGFMWSFEPGNGWAQICIPGWSGGQLPNMEAGLGFMWQQAEGVWQQLPVPRALHGDCQRSPPSAGFVPAGLGFMWKCQQAEGVRIWRQVRRTTWREDGPHWPPREPPGDGLMWIYKENYWQQQPIAGWKSSDAPKMPAGEGLMWNRVARNGEEVWEQDLIPDWEEDDAVHPPAEPAGEGLMWRYENNDGHQERPGCKRF
ncbi:unnamed protein product, partial [Effrenium voratum]